jgi:hypothetical protein
MLAGQCAQLDQHAVAQTAHNATGIVANSRKVSRHQAYGWPPFLYWWISMQKLVSSLLTIVGHYRHAGAGVSTRTKRNTLGGWVNSDNKLDFDRDLSWQRRDADCRTGMATHFCAEDIDQ